MGFVIEKITSEEDIALFNSFGFKDTLSSMSAFPYKWAIERVEED